MEGEKKKNNKGFKIFTILFVLIVIVLFGTKFKDKILPRKIEKTLEVVHKIPITDEEKVKFYSDRLIKWDNSYIRALNRDGTSSWEKEVNFEKPLVFFGEDTIYLCEKNTGDLYFLDTKGNSTKRVQLNVPIDQVVEKDNHIYIITKKEDTENIKVLSKEGSVLQDISSEGNILNFTSSEDNFKFLLSTLSVDNKNVQSKLIIYGQNGQVLSNTIFLDEIVTFVQFIDEDKILLMTDRALYKLKEEGILWKKDFLNIQDIYLDRENEEICVLEGDALEYISYDGKTKEKIELGEVYKKMYPYSKYLILVGDKNVLGLKKGKEILEYTIEENAKVIVDNSNILFITPDKINVMKMINKN